MNYLSSCKVTLGYMLALGIIMGALSIPTGGGQSLAATYKDDKQKEERPKANFPETDIFLFDINVSKQEVTISNGRNVTKRAGYDNQPYFTKDSQSFLFSRGDDYQTDVYEYFIASNDLKQVTNSPNNTEFSPTPFPGNQSISFVTDRSNSIWHGIREDIDNPEWTFERAQIFEPVGYYSWNHKTGYLVYWSQYAFSLNLVHQEKEITRYITGDAVPSTPHIIPGTDKFSFVHRQGNGQVWIKELDPETLSIRPLTPIVGANANYCWTPHGAILMIEGTILYRWHSDNEEGWKVVGDLEKHGVKSANRIAISPNGKMIAVVGLPQ